MKHIIWRHISGQSLEYCRFKWTPQLAIAGEIVGDLQGLYGALSYEVRCGEDGSTRWVHGSVRCNRGDIVWELCRQDNGLWVFNGKPYANLAACKDVDIGVTPATNTLPIRRLNLAVGASEQLAVAWVRFPDLTIHALAQRYTRLTSDFYRYESLASGFEAILRVDKNSIVQNYSDMWSRL